MDGWPGQGAFRGRACLRRGDRIRLAYLSSDLGNHPVFLLITGGSELHDRARFETTVLSFGGGDADEMRPRLKGAFEHFVDAHQKDDREVAGRMRDLEIDIAVDLNGFTERARTSVFARRAAPIQVDYLGYPGTLGAAYYEYILADRFVIPEDYLQFYSEDVVRLPACFRANDFRRRAADKTPSRSEMKLPEREFVFCCANNSYTSALFDTDRFRRDLEKAYTATWRRSQDGAPPASFDVNRL
jgi:predicted O-linked N-acetylglucosamine transferase (SPINDLY family)